MLTKLLSLADGTFDRFRSGSRHANGPTACRRRNRCPCPGRRPPRSSSANADKPAWRGNFAALGEDGIRRESHALKGGRWAGSEVADLHLHVYDEVIHHAAEVGLLRDLYRVKFS